MKGRFFLICGSLFLLPFYLQAKVAVQDSSSTEWIKIYFNQPADYSVALPGNMSKSNAYLIGSLESLMKEAKNSVDLAIYDL